MSKLSGLLRYRSEFKNYITVIFKMFSNKYPIEIMYRDGNSVLVPNSGFVHMASSGLHFNYNKNLDLLTFEYKNYNLKFYGSFYNNDFADTYGFQTYSKFNVLDRTVIDVGANIGDTSIYFALKGAKKVIALEPAPFAYSFLIKNISINNMEDIIIPINNGIGSQERSIRIMDKPADVTGTYVKDEGNGMEIKITTLTNIIKQFKTNNNLVLKMDCEGCEFDSLQNETDATLKSFSEIILEYHKHPYDLLKTLYNLNFRIMINNFNVKDLNKVPKKILKSHIGYIYAKQ